MISQTTPAGIRIGPISGPRTQVGLKTQPFNPEPYLKGQQMAINATVRKDAQLAAQEKAQLDFLKEQNAQFKNVAGSAGKSELISGSGIDVDPLTLKGRGALTKFNEYQSKMQQEMYAETAKATDGSGKLDQITAGRNVGIIQQKYQDLILNDPDIIEASIISRDRQQFIDNVDKLEKDGYFVSPRAKREALEAADNYLNDGTGELSYDKSVFNTEGMAFREEKMETDTMQLIADAVGETDFARVVSAASLGEGYQSGDGLISEKGTVQNERKRAIEIARERIEKDPRMKAFIQDRYNMDPQTYLETRIDGLLNEDDKREIVTSMTGATGAATGRRQREKSAADQKRKETTNNYGIEGNTEKDKYLRSIVKDMVARDPKLRATRRQLTDAQDFIEALNEADDLTLNGDNIRIDRAGRTVVREINPDGSLGSVIKSFGQAEANPDYTGGVEPDGNVGGLLALIDKTESGGDYNALYTFANKNEDGPFGNVVLSGMTVNEAIDFASKRGKGSYGQFVKDKLIASKAAKIAAGKPTDHRDRARIATPMGRYQMTGTTLKELKASMGLTGNELMNAETQDMLFAGKVKEQLARGDTMAEKMKFLRGTWEGYTHVDDATLQKAIEQYESGDQEVSVSPENAETSQEPVSEKSIATEASPHVKRDGSITTDQKEFTGEVRSYLEEGRNIDAIMESASVSQATKKKLEDYKKAIQEEKDAPRSKKQAIRDKISNIVGVLDDPEVFRGYVEKTLNDEEKTRAFEASMTGQLSNIPKGGSFQYDIEYREAKSGMGGTAPTGDLKNTTLVIGHDDDGLFAEFNVGLGDKTVEADNMTDLVKRIRNKAPFMEYPSDVVDLAFDHKVNGVSPNLAQPIEQDLTNELNSDDIVNDVLSKVNASLTDGEFTREQALDYITGKNKDGAIDDILNGLTTVEVEVVKRAQTKSKAQQGFDSL